MIFGWVWKRILAYCVVLEHGRENILLENPLRTFLETLDVFGISTSFCFRVRRSSTWSAQQMPTWLSLSAGAAPLTRMRCSLGTRWKSATSVLWSKDRHFSFPQVFSGPLWEHLRRAGRGELVASEPAPCYTMFMWLCGISFHISWRLRTGHQENSHGGQWAAWRLMVGRPRRRLIDFFALGYLVIESRTLSPMTLMMVTGRLALQAINQNDVGGRWGFSPKQHMPKLHP